MVSLLWKKTQKKFISLGKKVRKINWGKKAFSGKRKIFSSFENGDWSKFFKEKLNLSYKLILLAEEIWEIEKL